MGKRQLEEKIDKQRKVGKYAEESEKEDFRHINNALKGIPLRIYTVSMKKS